LTRISPQIEGATRSARASFDDKPSVLLSKKNSAMAAGQCKGQLLLREEKALLSPRA